MKKKILTKESKTSRKLKVLQLAPHPFYVERGTPIDVKLVLDVLSERENTLVDILVYHQGKDIDLPDVNLYRIPDLKFIKNIRPGISLKKHICNVFFFFKAWSLLKKNRYDLIHAGEEAVFFAMFFKLIYKIPYVYDIDSSIAQQVVEKKPYLKFLSFLFNWLEAKAIQGSIMNFPVCNALAELCETQGSKKTVTLHDISQLENPGKQKTGFLQRELGINKKVLLYIGNLEPYQGIDLLLDSFKIVSEKTEDIVLVIIGGIEEDILAYRIKAIGLGIMDKVFFLGPKPFDNIDKYLAEADIIACPRIRGINTPMKIFPFLHSGRPVVATDIYTHNQIISNNEAFLASPTPEAFAQGIINLMEDEGLCRRLAENGMAFVEKKHTYEPYKRRLLEAYDWIEKFGIQRKQDIGNVEVFKNMFIIAGSHHFCERFYELYLLAGF